MPRPPVPAPVMVNQQPEVEPAVWREVSPVEAKIPAVGSTVYYFPQGHAEQASMTPEFSGITLSKPYFLCRVTAVRYLADTESEEVLVRISLVPVSPSEEERTAAPLREYDLEKATSYSKVLTPSDANNGGGFSIPRACADIFPLLDLKTEMPVQVLVVSDLMGNEWSFRHVYRGNPRRHLLTTGWSKFVNAKKLVSGDTVVFTKNRHGKVFIGIRRRRSSQLALFAAAAKNAGRGFVRDGRGRVSPAAVVEAVRLAEEGRAFEVEFYPGKEKAEFVVAEGTVSAVMSAVDTSVVYAPGTAVRAPCKSVHPGVVTWYNGIISSAAHRYSGPWSASPWRMLEVTWYDSDDLSHMIHVSPWQVEISTIEDKHSTKEEGNIASNVSYSSTSPAVMQQEMQTEDLYGSSTNCDVVISNSESDLSTLSRNSILQHQDPNPVRLFGVDIVPRVEEEQKETRQDPNPVRLFGVHIVPPTTEGTAPTTPTSSSRGSTSYFL